MTQTRRFGFWVQEANIMSNYTAQNFFNAMFLTPPYPTTMEVMLFCVQQDQLNGKTPGATGSYTTASLNYWGAVAQLAQSYPNIQLIFEIAFATSGAGNVSGIYGLPGFQTVVSGLAKYSSVYGLGVEGEYVYPNTSGIMTAAQNIVHGVAKQFISYYVDVNFPATLQSGMYVITHTNFPGGDAGGYDPVSTLQNYTSGKTIGLDCGYYANFNFPATSVCPITGNATSGGNAGWNQCVVATVLSGNTHFSPASARQFQMIDAGFSLSTQYFTGVSNQSTNQLFDNSGLRNWIYNDPNYQPNFILSTSAPPPPALSVSVTANPNAGVVPLSVNFGSATSGGTAPYSYLWNFGDGYSGANASGVHIYSGVGVFAPSLTVTDSSSPTQNGSATATVTVNAPPLSVAVSGSSTQGTAPLSVNFSSAVSGGTAPLAYAWNFGDGYSGTKASGTHVYSGAGTFQPKLTVTDSSNPVQSGSSSLTIQVGTPPPLSVSISGNNSGAAPLTVDFVSVVSGGTAPFSYFWGFGDGASGTTASGIHTYLNSGNYVATLTVTDSSSPAQSGQTSMGISVHGNAPAPPLVISVSANPTSGNAPLSVTFITAVSGGTSAYSYGWNFGDGFSGTTASPTHTYSGGGTYSPNLTVSDSSTPQQQASATAQVTVGPPATALNLSVSTNPSSGIVPFTVSFTSLVSGGTTPYGYVWAFGDGSNSLVASPTHTYVAAGSYSPFVTVSDSSSPTQQATATSNIMAAPQVLATAIGANTTFGTSPLGVSFISMVSGGTVPFTYLWNFGDGTTGSTSNPSHVFQSGGTFTVSFLVTDASSPQQAASATVQIVALPLVFVPTSGVVFLPGNNISVVLV